MEVLLECMEVSRQLDGKKLEKEEEEEEGFPLQPYHSDLRVVGR